MVGVGETYLPAFGLALGMSSVAAGLIATLPFFLGGLLQLAAPRAIAQSGSYRRWVMICAGLQAASFIPLVIAAATQALPTWIVFASAALYWSAGMSGASGWNGWMATLIPGRVRGRYFGRRQSIAQAALLTGLAGGGLLLHLGRHAGASAALAVFALLFAAAAVCRGTSVLLLARTGEGAAHAPARAPIRLRSVAPRVRRATWGPLVGYLLFALGASALGGPFLTPFLLGEQHFSYGEYMILIAAVAAAKIACLPLMGNIIRRVGQRPILTFGAIGIVPLPLLWGASNSFWWMLGVQLVAGVFWAAFELAMFLTLFNVDDEQERPTVLAAFNAAHSAAVAGASVIGGVALAVFGSDRGAYETVFAMSSAARLLALLFLLDKLPSVSMIRPIAVPMMRILALRPWGGTIVKPILATVDRPRTVPPPLPLPPGAVATMTEARSPSPATRPLRAASYSGDSAP